MKKIRTCVELLKFTEHINSFVQNFAFISSLRLVCLMWWLRINYS